MMSKIKHWIYGPLANIEWWIFFGGRGHGLLWMTVDGIPWGVSVDLPPENKFSARVFLLKNWWCDGGLGELWFRIRGHS